MRKKFTDDQAEIAIKNLKNVCIADVCRELGIGISSGRYSQIRYIASIRGLDVSRWKSSEKWARILRPPRVQTVDYLSNSVPYQSGALKKWLFRDGLREKKCERCQRTEWEGHPIPLELHHVNGNKADKSNENIQILCCNCHALTPNFRGKQVRINRISSGIPYRVRQRKSRIKPETLAARETLAVKRSQILLETDRAWGWKSRLSRKYGISHTHISRISIDSKDQTRYTRDV